MSGGRAVPHSTHPILYTALPLFYMNGGEINCGLDLSTEIYPYIYTISLFARLANAFPVVRQVQCGPRLSGRPVRWLPG